MSENGNGTSKDLNMAFKYYKLTAKFGNAQALYKLG